MLDEGARHLVCVLGSHLVYTSLSDVRVLRWYNWRLVHVEHDISMWVLRSCFCFALWIWSEIDAGQDSSTSWLSDFAWRVIHIYVLVIIQHFVFACRLHMTVLGLLRRQANPIFPLETCVVYRSNILKMCFSILRSVAGKWLAIIHLALFLILVPLLKCLILILKLHGYLIRIIALLRQEILNLCLGLIQKQLLIKISRLWFDDAHAGAAHQGLVVLLVLALMLILDRCVGILNHYVFEICVVLEVGICHCKRRLWLLLLIVHSQFWQLIWCFIVLGILASALKILIGILICINGALALPFAKLIIRKEAVWIGGCLLICCFSQRIVDILQLLSLWCNILGREATLIDDSWLDVALLEPYHARVDAVVWCVMHALHNNWHLE